ncbi:MAG: EF-P beta-lysylation protein EpmB [Planctomycetia bacterium]|nr:EF-P beta-lysylation protein EpmB [Planctomycetia bacterium]
MPRSIAPVESAREHGAPWQHELAKAVRDVDELCRLLGLSVGDLPAAAAVFPLLVPRSFVARMRPRDPRDPLLLQVLPTPAEDGVVAGFTTDPLRERDAIAAPGLVHKYHGRALVLAAAGCAVNCRYCFRRDFPYVEHGATRAGVAMALEAVAADAELHEVILSGGDPLLLDDERLGEVVRRIEAISHVRRLRIHTRLPIVLPARVTDGLVAILRGTRLASVVVIHANHPAELDDDVAAACARLASAPAILLNQSVLLAGVNDSADILAALSERLVEMGIVPYYLHLLDRVLGTAHFEVGEEVARGLLDALRRRLPGYAVPRLAREVPGEPAKVWIG